MTKEDVAGLKIDPLTKIQLLNLALERIKDGEKTFIATPYSEFLFRSLTDNSLLDVLNQADFAVPDGIGIFWAERFLNLPLGAKNFWLKILQAYFQAAWSLAAIVFNPRWIRGAFPEKIPGSELIWDLAKLAANNNLSVYLLGGFEQTPELVKEKLVSKFPHLLISGYSNKNSVDPTVIEDINKACPDLLFVAFGPIVQEKWIVNNIEKISVKLAIGLGGTFDYIAGNKSSPPKLMRAIGLEWLFRLFTQPHRIKRIWQATFGLINKLAHYKVFMSLPMRPNAVTVILNKENKIFVGKKLFTNIDIITNRDPEKWKNYWQLPQGGVEEGEDAIAACKREAEEETGMTNLKYLDTSTRTHSYIWNNAMRGFWHNRDYLYRGQTQQILYFKFFGDDKNLKLPPGEEFVQYQWVNPNALVDVVHAERRDVSIIVREDLRKLEEKAII